VSARDSERVLASEPGKEPAKVRQREPAKEKVTVVQKAAMMAIPKENLKVRLKESQLAQQWELRMGRPRDAVWEQRKAAP
jgi:hypothetical protein